MDRKLITDCTKNGESFSSCSVLDLEILKAVDSIPTYMLVLLQGSEHVAISDFATIALRNRRD